MSNLASQLLLEKTLEPAAQAEVADLGGAAASSHTAVYPLGGGLGLGYGPRPTRPGIGVSLAKLKRVVDYPARDLTITVEAGMTLGELAAHLAAERQRLPVDVPWPDQATIGGALATNASGPRRCAAGTLRDYLLGFRAVDGQGKSFAGGGRVVKNAAGYDMCKLVIGSLGTLAVTTQVTLMVRPLPAAAAWVSCAVADFDAAERVLADVSHGGVLPTAVELLAGPAWADDPSLGSIDASSTARILVGLEGPEAEVEWMVGRLTERWPSLAARNLLTLRGEPSAGLWQRLTDFAMPGPNGAGSGALTAKIAVRPSAVASLARELVRLTGQLSLAAHAASGTLRVSVGGLAADAAVALLTEKLRPAAVAAGGNLVVMAAPDGARLSAADVWGPPGAGAALMQQIKQQFDPAGILNPGRFIFPAAPLENEA